MNCNDINFGTYDCSYNIMPPFKCGFGNEFKYVAVDKCLIKEIIDLWEQGIHTTGCCCGHGDIAKAFIGVNFEDISKMKALGYKVHFNPCRPDDEDSFIPKSILNYGEIQKGFNWWEENKGCGAMGEKWGEVSKYVEYTYNKKNEPIMREDCKNCPEYND